MEVDLVTHQIKHHLYLLSICTALICLFDPFQKLVFAQENASAISFDKFYTFYPEYGGVSSYPIHALVEQLRDTLYVYVKCGFKYRPLAFGVQRDQIDWQNDDMVEILIDPDCEGKDGYEFVINSINTQYDAKISNVNQVNSAWNYNWESKATIHTTFWVAQFWIPMRGLIRKAVDSIGIQILRGLVRRPNGVFEASSLVPMPPGAGSLNMEFTYHIPFHLKSSKLPAASGYLLPYLRAERLSRTGKKWKLPFGFEGKISSGNHWFMGAYRPDFNFVSANSYSLNILNNRFYVSENRYFFTESAKFTDLLMNTFYSKLISDKMDFGVQYNFDNGPTKIFLVGLAAPIVQNIFTGETTPSKYLYTMIAGSHIIGNSQVQANFSRLSQISGSGQPQYQLDLQGIYSPNWIAKAQFTFDVLHEAPVADVEFQTASAGKGFSFNGAVSYVSPKYNYPLSYLGWGNNYWSTYSMLGYTWKFDRSVVPSLGLGGSLTTISNIAPSRNALRVLTLFWGMELLPQMNLGYSFQYDDRPIAAFINRYHSLTLSGRLGRLGTAYGTVTTGSFFGSKLTYRGTGFSVTPLSTFTFSADYTARTMFNLTDEFYTVTATLRLIAQAYFRAYYQHLFIPSAQAKLDQLNFLINYYLTSRNNIYFLINLLDNLKTTDLMGRIGYEIDF